MLHHGNGGTTTATRLFYRFIAADEDAKNKPVLVFFNGGPGFTSMLLYTFGTGPLSLDSEAPGAPPSKNEASFSSLGNLLYIDARQAFEAWMGVPPEDVPGLPAAQRQGAFRLREVPGAAPLDPVAFTAWTGQLPEWDRYFSPQVVGRVTGANASPGARRRDKPRASTSWTRLSSVAQSMRVSPAMALSAAGEIAAWPPTPRAAGPPLLTDAGATRGAPVLESGSFADSLRQAGASPFSPAGEFPCARATTRRRQDECGAKTPWKRTSG